MENTYIDFGLCFAVATEKDLDGIVVLEKIFGNNAYKEEDLRKWWRHNPYMFYVIRDIETGEVRAFTIIAPITEEGYNKFRYGSVKDMDKLDLSDIVKTTISSPYYYFADVVAVSNKMLAPEPMLIFKNILPILWNNTEHIVTTPISKSGMIKAKELGAKGKNGEEQLNLEEPCYIEVSFSRGKAEEMVATMDAILARLAAKCGKGRK